MTTSPPRLRPARSIRCADRRQGTGIIRDDWIPVGSRRRPPPRCLPNLCDSQTLAFTSNPPVGSRSHQPALRQAPLGLRQVVLGNLGVTFSTSLPSAARPGVSHRAVPCSASGQFGVRPWPCVIADRFRERAERCRRGAPTVRRARAPGVAVRADRIAWHRDPSWADFQYAASYAAASRRTRSAASLLRRARSSTVARIRAVHSSRRPSRARRQRVTRRSELGLRPAHQ